MPIPSGSRLGSYEILALVGAGAMGEVYRARDARLGRDVAVKVLPRELTSDPERLARFEREARVLAALNHPNIATIHGVEEKGDVRALVMELVDGETLAELCARRASGGRALPLKDALDIARQIAAALEAAHDKGIVHRDLKPANVKVNTAGLVKVLDFGLAKVSQARDGTSEAAVTLAAAGTLEGAMLGTAAYMSPEQARGFPVDQSVDVWAFACVLYELLTGRRAFEAPTLSDTIAAVLEHEPDWAKLPATVPGPVRRLLQRCLNKDPRQRLRDIGAVRILVEDALVAVDPASGTGLDAQAARPRRTALAWVVAGLAGAALALGATAAYLWTRPPPLGETLRVSITAPGPISPQLSGAISPDGRHLAFVATGPSGRSMLWVRTLDSLEPRELSGTEGAAHPFWSPDNLSLGFIAEAKLKRVELAGGPVQTLADAVRAGGSWSRDGIIVFTPPGDKLAAVPAAGGPTTTLLTIDPAKGQQALRWPDFLPDGRHFLYYAMGGEPEYRGVYLGSLDSSETKRVLESDVRAKYAAPGYLLYLRDDALYAQRFDTERFELTGEPRPIADGVWFSRPANHASFSVSQTGTLAYVNSTFNDRQLVWFDRSGRRDGVAGPVLEDATGTPELAPDGRRIAFARGEAQFGDVWILDSALATFSRVTFSPAFRGVPIWPIWSANGEALLYRSGSQIVRGNLEDVSEETLLEATDLGAINDWSKDGRYVVLVRGSDLWVVDLLGDRQPIPYLETPFNEAQAQVSPNGQWIAYTASETGRDEVYVQSFPAAGRKRQISIDGGAMPRWRADGGELFFLAADQIMMAVPIGDAGSLDLGPPVPLFRAPLIVQGSESLALPTSYDVSPDGQRFLLMQPPENPGPPMTVVLNWRGALL